VFPYGLLRRPVPSMIKAENNEFGCGEQSH
jgi:hypothetical protein